MVQFRRHSRIRPTLEYNWSHPSETPPFQWSCAATPAWVTPSVMGKKRAEGGGEGYIKSYQWEFTYGED